MMKRENLLKASETHHTPCKNWLLIFLLLATALPAPGAPNQKELTIRVRGSDTMAILAQGWAEAYQRVNPNVRLDVSASGSGNGIQALIRGATDLADSSRQITPMEIEQAKRLTGKTVVEFVVGYDALAIYVHKDNPLEVINFAQLANLYGENGHITRWSDLGVTHPKLAGKKIVRVSRQSSSGTYEFLRTQVLGGRDYKPGAHETTGSKQMIDMVAHTPAAIGYAGMSCGSPKVKALKVKAKPGDIACLPSVENARNRSYPLWRPLRIYTLGEPQGPVKAYVEWLLSEGGQRIVEESGYVSVASVLPSSATSKAPREHKSVSIVSPATMVCSGTLAHSRF